MADDGEIRARLWGIRENLGVSAEIDDAGFADQVVDAAMRKIGKIVGTNRCDCAEDIIALVATFLGVQFEEVRSLEDIHEIKDRYLEKNEIGFGQLPLELADPNVDALLLERAHANDNDTDRFVAVLNLQDSESRGFWNRVHELSHRVAEPAQKGLPFYRHRAGQKNRVEIIVDRIAAQIAFYPPFFEPVVASHATGVLTWDSIETIRSQYAPTSSLLAITKAVLRYWPHPAVLVEAEIRGRKGKPADGRALRARVADRSRTAGATGVYIFPNMRVPSTSPIYCAQKVTRLCNNDESLSNWTTSDGDCLEDRHVFTSARPYGHKVLGLMTFL